MSRRLPLLLAALTVAVGALVWAGRDQTPHRRTPLDVGATAELDVAYGSAERNLLDVYTPATGGPHPVVVYFHPGGWVGGDKSLSIPIWEWTERGYAVVSVNYTFAVEGQTIGDSVDDAEAAVRFVMAEGSRWGLDTERLGVFGFSAGGHLALMLSQRELPLLAVASVGAPTNLVGLLDPTTPYFDGRTGEAVPALIRERLGCAPSDPCVRVASELSPTNGVAGGAPVLVIHGGQDLIVASSHATDMDAALRAQEADVELVIVPDGGHLAETAALAAFFDRFLVPLGTQGLAGP